MVFYSKGIDFNRFKLDLDKKYKYNCDKYNCLLSI